MATDGTTARKRAFKDSVYSRLSEIPGALANAHRLELLELLAQRPRTVQDLAAETALSVANASQHLQVLARAGLVTLRREGRFARYRTAGADVHRLLAAMRTIAEACDPSLKHAVQSYTGVDCEVIADFDAALEWLADPRVVLLDARPREEYDAAHLPDAIHVTVESVEQGKVRLSRRRRYVVYCRGAYCAFADEVVAALRERGHNATRLALGPPDWEAAGGELRRAG
jgi:rhodanese-related sulfurtransferase/DNA-binding transcriptional ArsR family regulator